MRIVHFSDIHFGGFPDTLSALIDKRILGSANFLLRRSAWIRTKRISQALVHAQQLAPDWIVCTGDITSTSSPREFALAQEALQPFVDTFGERLIYVPGNHDAYVQNGACKNALNNAFDMLNSGRWARSNLPFETGDGALRLFLVDEAQPNSWFMSTGRLDEPDRNTLHKLLDQPRAERETRILISHFPTAKADGRQLGARRRLTADAWKRQLLRDGLIDAALCGHIHRPFARWEPNGTAEFCAGSLTLHGWLNVVDCCDEKGTLSQFWVDVRTSAEKQPAKANLSAAPAC